MNNKTLLPRTEWRANSWAAALFASCMLLDAAAAQAVTPAIAAGDGRTVALRADGTLWMWGIYSYSHSGFIFLTNDRNTPQLIGDGYSAVTIAGLRIVALKPDGSLWAFDNALTQIGSGYSAIAPGTSQMALEQDSSLWAWGGNYYGQLGDGTITDRDTPVLIGNGYSAVAAGSTHTVALKPDGSLWAWGSNDWGQLGDGTTTDHYAPVLIGNGYSAIAAGGSHTMALKPDGSLWAWGNNYSGQLGDGTTTDRHSPVLIGYGYSAVTTNDYHTAAMKPDGSLWAWGANNYGQLGDGTTTSRHSPVLVGSGFSAVAGGRFHTVAARPDGSLWAWGYNYYGQLGNGSSMYAAMPARVVGMNLYFPIDNVVEFYNTNLDHYFITADFGEAAAIDNGSAGPGWVRTGHTFRSGGDTAACRFYGSLSPGPNAHFYTLDGSECDGLKALQQSTPATQKRWNFESLDFVSTPPVNGACTSGTQPIYRVYNNGFARGVDSNHRITASLIAIQEVVDRGWSNEGVVMCAPN